MQSSHWCLGFFSVLPAKFGFPTCVPLCAMISKEKHILTIPEGNRYSFAVNRYRLANAGSFPQSSSGAPVTLILAHGLGLRK